MNVGGSLLVLIPKRTAEFRLELPWSFDGSPGLNVTLVSWGLSGRVSRRKRFLEQCMRAAAAAGCAEKGVRGTFHIVCKYPKVSRSNLFLMFNLISKTSPFRLA